jgi:hypothetical protein
MRDEMRRRPPVSLAGRFQPGPLVRVEIAPKPKPPPVARTTYGPQHLDKRSRLAAEEPTDEDALGPWTLGELLVMDRRFRGRVERAFKRGTETREAASASYQCEKFSDLPLNRIASPLW